MNNGVFENEKLDLAELKKTSAKIAEELIEKAGLIPGSVVVIGCSTSEIEGEKIGSHSTPEVAGTVFEALFSAFAKKGIYLAAQCCEHLNRSIVIDREALENRSACSLLALTKGGEFHEVNVVPQPKAGGSFATAAYHAFREPVMLTGIAADAGLDIGGTLIGMHLKSVAVPLRLEEKQLGNAMLIAARVRKPFAGGSRAIYDEKLL